MMKETDLQARVETLEVRLAHQDVAIEELTRTVLGQETRLNEQIDTIERLQGQVRSLAVSPLAPPDQEPPPPHY